MKKVIIGIVIVGILAVLGAPFATGLMMERVVKQSVKDVTEKNRAAGSDVSFEIVDYKRSFSSSRIEWKINLGQLKSMYGIDEIRVVDQAKHGFTGVVSKSSIMSNKWYKDMVDANLDGKDPLDITTEYKLFGKAKATVAVNAFSFEDGSEIIKVKPAKLVVACGNGFKTISSQGSCEGISVQDKFTMDGFSFSSDMEMISDYIWNGEGSITVKTGKAEASNEPFEMSNLKAEYSMNFDKEDNTVSIGVGYGVDSLLIDVNKIDKSYVRIGINNVDASGYEELIKLYTKTVNNMMKSITDTQNDSDQVEAMQQQMAANGMQFMAAFEKVLKDGLEIKVSDLNVKLPNGEIKGDIALRLTKDMTMAQFFPIANEPKLALDIFSLQSDLSLPADLLGDDPTLLSPVYPGMQTGLFMKEGAQIVHKAETKDGKLILNGQEVLLN